MTRPARLIDRRAAIARGGVAALGALLPACAARGGVATGTTSARLVPVQVAGDRIIRRTVGLRPYRPTGFVVRTERVGDTMLVHNYGHGGGGISLSWGTAHLAVEEAAAARVASGGPPRAAVIGSGVVGLSTTRLLQRYGWDVTIYTKALPPDTTSNVAGGQWTPTSVFDEDAASPAFIDQFVRASRFAYREFQDYVGDTYGVRWIDNYYLNDEPPEARGLTRLIPDVFPGVRVLEAGEHPFGARYALRVTTMLIEPAIYLRALLGDARIAGASVVVREFADVGQLTALPESVVINCTGLGAGALLGDEGIMPVKGQLTILRPQPDVDYMALQGDLYMFPRSDGILLGGTFERGVSDLALNVEAERRIVDGHRRLFGAMR